MEGEKDEKNQIRKKEQETIFRDPGRSNAHHVCDTGIFCLGGRGSAGIWRQ